VLEAVKRHLGCLVEFLLSGVKRVCHEAFDSRNTFELHASSVLSNPITLAVAARPITKASVTISCEVITRTFFLHMRYKANSVAVS
jgi:hypothetical protein